MTRIFRFGVATEVVLNVGGALAFVAWPEACLACAAPAAQVTPLAALLWQLYGALVLALSVPLALCLRDADAVRRAAVIYERRRIVFTTLAAGEIAIIALFLRHAALPPGPDDPPVPPRGLLAMVAFLLPALAWHSFALFARPSLMQPVAETPGPEGKKDQ